MRARASLLVLFAASALAGGCLVDRGAITAAPGSGDSGVPSDAWVSPIDADHDAATADAGSDAGEVPDAATCTVTCADDGLLRCAERDDVVVVDDCGGLGCVEGPPARCKRMVLANLGDSEQLEDVTEPLIVASGETYEIDTGTLSDVRVMADGLSEAAVLRYTSITIDGTLRVTGSRPLILAARDGITVTGLINAAANGATAGPGGLAGSASPSSVTDARGHGGNGEHVATYRDGGGGGGALCGTGGSGGAGGSARGGEGGRALDLGGDLTTLRGGGGGGAGAGEDDTFGAGGAGGGALQLSTFGALTITRTARVQATGGAGVGGRRSALHRGAGGGGGAGGFVLLEGLDVVVEGAVNAAGGQGGNANTGTDGGAGAGDDASTGANGGTESGNTGNGGGGGGGGGCVTIRSNGAFTASAAISPRSAASLHTTSLDLR